MSVLNKILIFFIAFFSLANINLYANFSVVDLLLLFYVSASFYMIDFKIRRNTFAFILFANLSLLLSFIFIFFSKYYFQSFIYLSQLWFVVTALPLFFESLLLQGKFYDFIRSYLMSFVVISAGFLVFGILHFTKGIGSFWIYRLSGLHRISFGDTLVSNDLGIFFITGILLIQQQVQNTCKRKVLSILITIAYLLTLSRTIAFVAILFWLFYFRKFIFKTFFWGISIILISFPFIMNIPRVGRLLDFGDGGNGRLIKIQEAFSNILVFIFPLHGQGENKIVKFEHGVQSIHNFFLNLIVNIGFIQSLILLIPFLYALTFSLKQKKTESEKIIVFALILQMLVISINALMLTRAIWMAIFLLIFYYVNCSRHALKLQNDESPTCH
ncbi:MAG: hypothetical protein JW783_13245 [Bacteroidales bacterium]|nr:hypothetical protein [Bacteroidales bacterium]